MWAIDTDVLRDFATGNLLGQLPYVLVAVVGIVLGWICLQRHRGAAWLLTVGLGLLILRGLITPVWIAFRITRDMRMDWDPDTLEFVFGAGTVVLTVMDAGSLALLIGAALVGRRAPAPHHAAPPAYDRAGTPRADTAGAPREISKSFYMGGMIAAVVLAWLLAVPGLILGQTARRTDEAMLAMGLSCSACIPAIIAAVFLMIVVYRMWAALQDDPLARTTPGRAVGFLFIPFFNFYWIFVAYRGWAVDYDRYVHERGIAGPRAPRGLAMTVCILALCSLIPIAGLVLSLVNAVLMLVFVNRAIDGTNAIVAACSDRGDTPAAGDR